MKDTAKKVKLISDEIRALAQEAKKINQVAIGKNLQMLAGEVRRVETKEANKTKIRDVAGKVKHFDTAKGTSFSKDFQEAFTGINVNSSLNDLVTKAKELGNTDMAKGIREFQQELNKEKGMQELNEQVKEVKSSLEKLGYDSTTIDKFEQKIKDTTQETNKLTTSLRKVSEVAQTINSIIPRFVRTALSIQGLKTIFNTIIGGFNKIIGVTEQSSAYIENLHMFEVSMGRDKTKDMLDDANKYYKRGIEFQNQLHEAFSTNMSDTLKYQGLFNQMAKSMSIPAEQAYLLSENFTKLGYDLSSLFNLDPEDAMQKLRAGLAGQTKPLRDIGLDITQQTLAPKLKELGIDKSVKQLTQAEKMVLRYIVVLEQAKASHGDFADTIDQPANQLKILKEQIKELTQAFGNMFLPILKKILPYINGFVMALKEVINVLAGLFGYTKDMGQGMSSVNAEEIDLGYGEELEEAKKLKSYTLGFDELNVLKEDDSDSNSAGLGGAVDSRLLEAMEEYDNRMGEVANKAREIRDLIMEWLGFIQTVNEEGEITWTYLDEGYTGLEKIKTIAMALLGIKLTFGLLNTLANLGVMLDGLGKLKNIVIANKSVFLTIGKVLAKIAIIVWTVLAVWATIKGILDGTLTPLQLFFSSVASIMAVVATILILTKSIGIALVGGIITALAILIVIVAKYWDEVVYMVKTGWSNLSSWICKAFTSVGEIVLKVFVKIGGEAKILGMKFYDAICTIFEGIGDLIMDAIGGVLVWVAEKVDNVLNAFIKPINEIVQFFGGDGFAESELSAKVQAWVDEKDAEREANIENKRDNRDANIEAERMELEKTLKGLSALGDDIRSGYDALAEQRNDVYWSEYMTKFAEKQAKEAEEEAKKAEEATNATKENTNAITDFTNTIGEQVGELTSNITGSVNVDTLLNDSGLDVALEKNADIENDVLGETEQISDELSFSNDLTDKTNTTLGSIYNFLKTELMTKLQGIKEACENIRINIIHEHYYGGEGYATGGMPSSASLFYAHENGMPELVGKMGNNTAVMNNEQIVSAVAMGVAEAVASVMGERQTIVQIDGKEILSATEKAKKTRGYGIVGGAFAKG
ncbi:MAG: hypothetical protein IJX99_06955 [Clostridia bacterium]|nr:hypothetical protein [Clostridia bacterium]